MKMEKRKFRIGELAKSLDVKQFVIRFWEKEFDIKCNRSEGKQRFYSKQDVEKFRLIKELLYEKKFTLEGAKKELKNIFNPEIKKNQEIIPSQRTDFIQKELPKLDTILEENIRQLRNRLKQLKELL